MSNENTAIGQPKIIQMYGMFNRAVNTRIIKPFGFELKQDVSSSMPIGSRTDERRIVMRICDVCHDIYPAPILTYTTSIGYVCDDCKKDYTRPCDDCKQLMIYDHPYQSTLSVVDHGVHKIVCNSCGIRKYIECDVCHAHVDANSTELYGGVCRCYACNQTYLSTQKSCRRCGDYVLKEHLLDGYCVDCFKSKFAEEHRTPEKEIRSYSNTVGNAFFSTEGGVYRHYGCEWEGENGKESREQSNALLQRLWYYRECDVKKDASVSRGFEIATYPLGLGYHKKYFHWESLFALLEEYGFKGHDCPTAGFHIHISKIAFGDTPRKQARNIAAFTYLVQRPDWRGQMKKFSRRDNKAVRKAIEERRVSSSDPWHYCGFFNETYPPTGAGHTKDYGITQGYQQCLKENKHDRNTVLNYHIYKGSSEGRVINPNTIELRLNKSTMNANTVYAMLELCDVFIDISTSKWTEASLRALTWRDMCRKIPSTSGELKEYLKKLHIWED